LQHDPIPLHAYGTITLSSVAFQQTSASSGLDRIRCKQNPTSPLHYCSDSVWTGPLSLAATYGISFDFFSSCYSDVSFRRVRVPQRERKESRRILFTKSHSGILGSTDACSYPRHIAACHALHRLPSLAIHQTASARRMITLSTNAYATCARRSSQAEQKLATSFDSRRPPSRSASLLFSPTRRDWQGLTCHPSKNGKLTRAFSFLDSQKANRLPPNARNFFLRR
jgi:hypothetical protein